MELNINWYKIPVYNAVIIKIYGCTVTMKTATYLVMNNYYTSPKDLDTLQEKFSSRTQQ